MGDSGEGLVDNEARIHERMEELQRNRELARRPGVTNPALARQLESLELARKEIIRAIDSATHPARKTQLTAALADIEGRIAVLK
jgi:DNA-binding HxlR family transcriptional regulator